MGYCRAMQNIWSAQNRAQQVDLQAFDCDVKPAAGSMGAYVNGLDVSKGDNAVVGQVKQLLRTFKAVMLRGQPADLDIESFVEFGNQLGDLAVDPYVEPPFEKHPQVMGLVREADSVGYNFGGDWHSDGSYLEHPGGLTILWGADVPPYGGDTIFSNMELAWHTLSDTFREMLDGRRCLHSATGLGDKVPIVRKGDYAAVNFDAVDPNIIEHCHPIKRTHPETGAHSLFVNQAYSRQIEGCHRRRERRHPQLLV